MMKKWITFDLDGTLMQNPFIGHVFPEIERKIYQQPDVKESLIKEHFARMEAGRTVDAYDWDDMLRSYMEATGIDCMIDVEILVKKHCQAPAIYLLEECIPSVLKKLREKGYSLAAVTNGFLKYQLPVMDALDLTQHFDEIITPEKVGCAKPDMRIFDSLKSTGEITAHVGDRIEHDVQCANMLGIQSIFIYRALPDQYRTQNPMKRNAEPVIREAFLQKLRKETRKEFLSLPTDAIPNVVLFSIDELLLIF
ncbi:HAD family hydrolase [Lederbergia citrea]|uniref:HAD family hydrolase n=1 Tax=Lederbergia citrea TaxID=2833581 RepID=A0A942UL96_9BACI|nr:HAD family hydrolase [Lederbergia citrea]MBS4177950.1 HAD family hydrolase [Lederbergia citrea]MBS4204617.1 HAD family hydrolase [Lederbergia citrea]MBS4223536.1 HAD family hydrolase [Lederbergia citrea]